MELRGDRPKVFERLKARLSEYEAEAVEPNIPPNRAPKGFEYPEVWGAFE
jgi:hypothetical protein